MTTLVADFEDGERFGVPHHVSFGRAHIRESARATLAK
jgi:hypothetical protein